MNPSVPPSSDPLRRFIDAARELEQPPADSAQHLWQRVSGQLDAIDVSLLGSAPGVAPAVGAGLKSYLVTGVLGLAVGGAVALPLGYQWGKSAVPAVLEAPPAPPPLELTAPVPPPVAAPVEPPSPAPARAVAVKPRPPPTAEKPVAVETEESALEQERLLLERMRTALMQRRLEAVDEALGEHEQRFAQGQLVEEREAMRIQRWVLAPDPLRATELLQTFRQRFPHSRLSSVLGQQVESISSPRPPEP